MADLINRDELIKQIPHFLQSDNTIQKDALLAMINLAPKVAEEVEYDAASK